MKRSPLLHWLITMATLGQYAFVWAFFLARDVNKLAGTKKISVKAHATIFGIAWAVYIAGFTYAASVPLERLSAEPAFRALFFPMFALAVCLLGYFLWLLLTVAKELRTLGGYRVPSNPTIIGLSLLYMTSLPLLQSRMNRRT